MLDRPLSDLGEVRVVWAAPVRSSALEAILDDAERARITSFRREDDRRRFVASHALARLVLSQATGLPATRIRFAAQCRRCGGAHGKTRVATAPQLHISISHAAGRVAVAVTLLGPVGVDLEPTGADDLDGLADVALTTRERVAFAQLPSEQRSSAVLTWWVRKEAVLKATGDGMFVAPADIEISGPAEEPRLIAWTAGGEPKAPMQLRDLQLGPGYMGCVGVLSHRTPLVRLTEGDEMLAAAAVPLRTTMG
jgi:4'-phosphopantetheinyl transferase